MTTRLSLICHAPTAAHRAVLFPADEPLDPQGRQKLTGLPHRLHADRLLTSPALRAVQTAGALRLDATVDPMLRECDYGRWAGRSFADAQAEEPEAIAAWMRDPAAAPHGGESILQLIDRGAAWLALQSAIPGRVLAITHASVMRALVLHALDAPPRSFWRIDIAPLDLVQLSGTDGRWNLTSLGPAFDVGKKEIS